MPSLINWPLFSNPINWLVVSLMATLSVIAVSQINKAIAGNGASATE